MRLALIHNATRRMSALRLVVGALAAAFLITLSWVTYQSAVLAASNEKSYVILLRHGDAPGRGEPPGFELHDCSTQRNLSDKGRGEARELGALLRGQGINVTKVLTSRWCRTKETAELLNLGPVENSPVFDNFESSNRGAQLLNGERELIASWHGPGVLVVVTHSSNIKALTGLEVEQGKMIVASRTPGGNSTFRLRIAGLQKGL